MSHSVIEMTRSVTDVVTVLAGIGFDTGRLASQSELVIDKFDQWTNPQNTLLLCTCTSPHGANLAVARVA